MVWSDLHMIFVCLYYFRKYPSLGRHTRKGSSLQCVFKTYRICTSSKWRTGTSIYDRLLHLQHNHTSFKDKLVLWIVKCKNKIPFSNQIYFQVNDGKYFSSHSVFVCLADPSSSTFGHWWLRSSSIFISSSNAQVSSHNKIIYKITYFEFKRPLDFSTLSIFRISCDLESG